MISPTRIAAVSSSRPHGSSPAPGGAGVMLQMALDQSSSTHSAIQRHSMREDLGLTIQNRMPWRGSAEADPEPLLTREWLVTNGLGGYATGTIAGASTRRYHGLLIAAL